MEAIDILGLLIPVTFVIMLLVERRWPARAFPPIRGWSWIGLGFLILMATLSTVLPLLIPQSWLAEYRLLDLSALGVVPGALVGYLVYSLVFYFYHRSVHALPWLWRFTHQLHHGPQRLDIPGATVFHPIELVIFIVMSVVTSVLLGLEPVAAALTGYIAAFYSFFQHWNIRTPHWLGYFIQRPEAHCIHHQRDVHAYNYADFPLWDMLFGTFRNPWEFSGEVGFDAPQAHQYGKMLMCQDVHATEAVMPNASKAL